VAVTLRQKTPVITKSLVMHHCKMCKTHAHTYNKKLAVCASVTNAALPRRTQTDPVCIHIRCAFQTRPLSHMNFNWRWRFYYIIDLSWHCTCCQSHAMTINNAFVIKKPTNNYQILAQNYIKL